MSTYEFIVNSSYNNGSVIALINSDIDAQIIGNTRTATSYSLGRVNLTFQNPLDDTNSAIIMQIFQNRDTYQYSTPIQLFQYINDSKIKVNNGGAVTNLVTDADQQNLFSKALIGKNTSQYSTGTASQSGTTITGVGTTFTKAMLGGIIIFADGSSAGLNAYGSATSLTSGISQTVAEQTYTIYYGATNIMPSGKLSAISPLLASPSITDPNDGTKSINILSTGLTTGVSLTLTSNQSTTQTLTIPNITAADNFVTEAFAQSLTNKTLTDTSNNITARGLATASGTVAVSAATAPTAGQVLTATDGVTATWQTPAAGGFTLNTLTAASQTFAVGTAGSDFAVSSNTSTHTFNIPDAGAAARGLVTTGAQTFAGAKTFSSAPVLSALTASQAVVTDASKNLASLAYTSAATASTLMSRNTSANVALNNILEGYTTTATAAGTTTLTVASTRLQYFTGSTTQTIVMPVTNTLVLGQSWIFRNLSSGNLTLNASDASNIDTILPSDSCYISCISTSVTSNAGWVVRSTNSASRIKTTGSPVVVSTAAPPTTGQVLTATSATAATWQTPAATGISTLNTLTAATQTFAVGTAGSDFAVSSNTSTHTFNIPDAGAAARGLVTTGAQTFAGVKTFSSAPVISTITNTGIITLPTATDTLVARATTDALTNKTLTGTTNTIAASQLRTATADVVISAATAPSVGQVLTASGSGTTAIWATPSGGTISWTETPATADAAIVLSTTYATLTSMTVTPASGTYLVTFSSSAKTTSSTVTNFYAIFSAGAIVQHSQRNHGTSGGTQVSNSDFAMHTQAVVTVNGSQAIDVRIKSASSSPTFTFHGRSLTILKLA